VALQIAAALRAELTTDEKSRVGKEPTGDLEAYQLYLQGRHCHTRYTSEGMKQAVEYFQRAITRDPGYAMAYVGVAIADTELGETGSVPPEEVFPRAKEAVARALALDSELGDAYCAQGHLKAVVDFDWAGAERDFRRALELSPNGADTYDLYGRVCAAQERYDEAVALQQRAYELDPLAHRADVANALIRAGRYDEAVQAATRSIELDPNYDRGVATLGWAYLKSGRREEGLAQLERAAALSPGASLWLAQLGEAYGLMGMTDKARAVLGQLETQVARGSYVSPYHMAYIYTGLGEQEVALDWLERAFRDRSGAIYGIKGSFLFATLRSHPRFVALLKKMNLA
jgi:tetratricopeptide (TPR) repeat protein